MEQFFEKSVGWINRYWVILLVILLGIGLSFWVYNFQSRRCSYQILDIKEYKGSYGVGSGNYFTYEGLIKNNSNKTQYLKEMVGKMYNEKNIFIGEAYTKMNISIGPNVSIPFNIKFVLNPNEHSAMGKYISESLSFKPDIYPWFTTCK